ncbi:hypothetical protein [Brevibacterium litoralis]|uniref:hypothetical protein n=1 Tax=Brevibacterium litoralis TaxID=3138935 RepID=UPI0032EC069E
MTWSGFSVAAVQDFTVPGTVSTVRIGLVTAAAVDDRELIIILREGPEHTKGPQGTGPTESAGASGAGTGRRPDGFEWSDYLDAPFVYVHGLDEGEEFVTPELVGPQRNADAARPWNLRVDVRRWPTMGRDIGSRVRAVFVEYRSRYGPLVRLPGTEVPT